MRARVRRVLSVSHRDLFRPGPANVRVAIFLYGFIGVMLSLWLFIWCAVSCRREVEREVSLSSGQSVPVVLLHHGSDASWVEYITKTGGEPEAVRVEVARLLEALRSSPDFPSGPRRMEFHAMRLNLRIWGWYGPFPDLRCCTKTVVMIDRDGEEERLFETFAYDSRPRRMRVTLHGPYNIAFERSWPSSSGSI